MIHHVGDLAVTNPVPVEDDPGGKLPVEVVILPEHLEDVGAQVVVELLGRISGGVHVGQGHVPKIFNKIINDEKTPCWLVLTYLVSVWFIVATMAPTLLPF